MFALDLFNNDHERRLAEGAVDQLEQRRIDDLAMKMDDLVARAKQATTPEVKAALVKEFQKCKDERDGYYKVRNETMGYGGLGEEAHEFKGPHGKLDVTRTPGKTVVTRKEYPGSDEMRTDKFPNSRLKGKGVGSATKSGSGIGSGQGSMRKFARLDHDGNDEANYEVDESGIPGNIPTEKIPGKEDLLKGKGRSYYESVEDGNPSKKVFKDKAGKPVGEIGIDPESSPGNGEWYVYHYGTGYSVVGFDSAAEAKRELLYVHKHPEAVEGHESTFNEADQKKNSEAVEETTTDYSRKRVRDRDPDAPRSLNKNGMPVKPRQPKSSDYANRRAKEKDVAENLNVDSLGDAECPRCHQHDLTWEEDSQLVNCRNCGANFEESGKEVQGVAETENKDRYELKVTFRDDDVEDPESYGTMTEYWFDVFKNGKLIGEASANNYFANLYVRLNNGKEVTLTHQKNEDHPLMKEYERIVWGLDEQGVAEATTDQVKKVFKKNGKPVGEVGIDPKASPGNGQWYMKCYSPKMDYSGYDSFEEAVKELGYCLSRGVEEGIVDTIRSKNYDRLANRSQAKKYTALDNSDEPEYQKQTNITKQRKLKARLLNKQGVAESDKYEPAPKLINIDSIPGLNHGGVPKAKSRLGHGGNVGIQAPDRVKTRGAVNNFKNRVADKLRDRGVAEGFQDFNRVEPYAVCLAGKPVKRFDYYEQARRFHDNWKQKLYREGDKAKADTITLLPLNLDEAMNKNDLLGNVAKDLNTQFKKAKSGKLKASGDFTKGDHWQGAKPGDYGYTGYQGHGMPKDNPKKNKGVAEGTGPQSKLDQKIIHLLTNGIPADAIARKLDIPIAWVDEVAKYNMPDSAIDYNDPRNTPPTNRFGEGVVEGSFAHDQLKGEINDLFKPVVLQIVKWARAEGMTAKDLAGTSSHFFLDALDPDTYDRTQHLPDNYFNKLMDKANAKAVEILKKKGVAESATAPIIVPKRRAKAKSEPKFDIPYSADDYVPPALAMASAEALDRIIADPSTKETTRELAKKAKAQKQGVAEAIVASGPSRPLDDRAVRKLVWDTMKINADTGEQAIERALSVLAKKPQSRMVQDLQDKFQNLADRLSQGVAEAKPITSATDTTASAKKLWQYIGRNLEDLASNADFDAERNELYINDRLNNLFKTADGQPVQVAFDMGSGIALDKGILYIPIGTIWQYRGMYTSEKFINDVVKALSGQTVSEASTDYQKRRQRERDVDAGKPVAKQRQPKMTDYQKRRAQDKKDMALGEESSTSSDAVERAILNRIMTAHTDLLMKFGPQKVMQAAEEVAYNVGDVDEIGTSDVSAYVAQVKQILGVTEELDEKWSQKYKSSINCSNPKGFSQKAHCAGKKK